MVDDLNQSYLEKLPIRRINFVTSDEDRTYYLDKAKLLYRQCVSKDDQDYVLRFVNHHLAERSDVVHDFLAFLAEEMLRLNEEKRDEQQRFLAEMVKLLKVRPDKDGREGIDALANKQRIVEYPGEYQKGTPELKFDDLFELLYKNKPRLGIASLEAVKDTLRTEYEKSLDFVRPRKEQLEYTDALIDAVVYQLYGLTQDEIDVVEGKVKVVDSNV